MTEQDNIVKVPTKKKRTVEIPDIQDLLGGDKNKETEDVESNKDKKIKYVLDNMMSDDDLEKKTDINKNQIKVLSKALLYAETFNVPIVAKAADYIMQLSISKDRKGRKELMEVGKSYGETEDASALSKMFGKGIE